MHRQQIRQFGRYAVDRANVERWVKEKNCCW